MNLVQNTVPHAGTDRQFVSIDIARAGKEQAKQARRKRASSWQRRAKAASMKGDILAAHAGRSQLQKARRRGATPERGKVATWSSKTAKARIAAGGGCHHRQPCNPHG